MKKLLKASQEQKFFNTTKADLNAIIVTNSITYLQQEFFNYIDELYLKDGDKPQSFAHQQILIKYLILFIKLC